jgi:hypothetical protein
MKKLLFLLLLGITLPAFSQIQTNGVYVLNNETYEVDKKLHEITNAATLYFSNDLTVKTDTNCNLQVSSFYQEILNTDTYPIPAQFGSSISSLTLMNGSATVIYGGTDTNNSSCIISTPMVDIELYKGTFHFRVNDNKVLVFVLNGSLKSHGEKNRENVVTAGYAVIAVPNDIGILEAKISIGAEKVRQDIIDKLNNDSKDIADIKKTIMFIRIDGTTRGVIIN